MTLPPSVLPPLEAYRYWPQGEDVYFGKTNHISRLIFTKTPYSPFEVTELTNFKAQLPSLLTTLYSSSLNDPELPSLLKRKPNSPYFSHSPEQDQPSFRKTAEAARLMIDPELLRMLIACKFDHTKAAEALADHLEWRASVMPDSYHSLWEQVQEVMQRGAVYIHGRDHRFRPIVVVNLERLDLQEHSANEYSSLLCFTLEFIVSHMLLPGQIENWVVIVDVCSIGLTSLPKKVRWM
jgi:hypothetical protein